MSWADISEVLAWLEDEIISAHESVVLLNRRWVDQVDQFVSNGEPGLHDELAPPVEIDRMRTREKTLIQVWEKITGTRWGE